MAHLFSVYLGVESENGFSGFVAEDNFYCILEIKEGFSSEKGRLVLRTIADTLKQLPIKGLNDFDAALDKCIKENSLPMDLSLSAAYKIDSILYLKTIGEGEVLIRRNNQFATLIKENNTASGKIEENDLFIFSTKYFTQELNGVSELEPVFDHKKPVEIVEALTPIMKEKNDKGAICLFVQFIEKQDEQFGESTVLQTKPGRSVHIRFPSLHTILPFFSAYKKKIGIFLGIFILFLLLILNSGKLFIQKKQMSSTKSYDTVNQEVRGKIDEAGNIVSSDLKGASRLLSESYALIAEYKQKTKDTKTKELEQFLEEKKKEFLRIKTVISEEVTDLALEEEGAKGDIFALYGDTLSILNKKGSIYLFSLEKNTLKRFKKTELTNANLIAQYEKKTYVYKQSAGIYEITEDGIIKKIIEQDDSWSNLISIQGYNANLYIVDAGTDDIYKYIGGESGFSGKTSYLQSGKPDLTKANALAIDSALYISLPDTVLKYLTGVKQDFQLAFPVDADSLSITKVITYKDVDTIYVWEKGKGLIYVFDKDGSYKFQVASSNLLKATDVVVYKDNAFGIIGNKIYSFALGQ